MRSTSVRELRNRGDEVLARVQAGESLIVTSNGAPVAELRPLTGRPPTTLDAIEQMQRIGWTDPGQLRREIDAVIDPAVPDRCGDGA